MNNSFAFFENKECEYYPCHKGSETINCLFCYCPLYDRECPGSYHYITNNGSRIKDCTDCDFPHKPENYDIIIKLISK